jgi:hypothetical protein
MIRLADGTDETTCTAGLNLDDCRSANRAGLPFSITYQDVFHLKITFVAKEIHFVKGAAFSERGFQPAMDSPV